MSQTHAAWVAAITLFCGAAVSHAAETPWVYLAAGRFQARSGALRASGPGWFLSGGVASRRHPTIEWGSEIAVQLAHYDTLHYVVSRWVRPGSHLERVSATLLGSIRAGPQSTVVWPHVYGGAGLVFTSLEFPGSTFGFPGSIDRERRLSLCGALGAGIDVEAGKRCAIGFEVRRWWTTRTDFGPLTPDAMDLGGLTAAVAVRLQPKPRPRHSHF